MRFFFLILILIVMFPKPVCADILKFGILADTRCGELPSSGWNETGVNTSAVNAIARDMVNENVNFVLAGGDLIHGQFFPFDYIPLSNMYIAWTNAMGPVQNANIPIYPVPGNHEYYYGTFQVHTNASAAGPVPMTAWSNIFEDLPKNGPDGKVGRTYSFSFSNVFLMGIDQYKVDDDLSYLLDTNFTYEIQNDWVTEQIVSNSLRHIFVFGHFPAFTLTTNQQELCGGGSIGLGGLAERQAFWDGLGAAGCRVYFGAHQHLYARSTASISNGPAMQHVIIGNSGAPHEDWNGVYDENGHNGVTIVPEYHEGSKGIYGYVLVEVDGLNVKIVYKSSNDLITWTNKDSFSYTLIPLPPVCIAPSNIGTNNFTVNWKPSAGVEYYLLDVSVTNAFTSFVNEYHNLTVIGSQYTVTGLYTGSRYYYRVRAADSGGTSDYSLVGTVWTEPSVPHALSATGISTNKFTANWLSAEGATNYLLYVSKDSDFNEPLTGYNPKSVGTAIFYSVSNLSPGTEYFYRLKAQNTSGITTNSHTILVWTAPASPHALEATNITINSFYANWDFSTGSENYYLDVSKTNSFSNFVIGNLNVGTALTWHVNNLIPEEKYYFRVRAANTGGISENSTPIEVILVPEPCILLFFLYLLLSKRSFRTIRGLYK